MRLKKHQSVMMNSSVHKNSGCGRSLVFDHATALFFSFLFQLAHTPLTQHNTNKQQNIMFAPSALLLLLLASSATALATPRPSTTAANPAPCDAACRRTFCVQISQFLSAASCGPQHAPCLSLALQEDVNARCLAWRGSRRDSLAWDSSDAAPPELRGDEREEGQMQEEQEMQEDRQDAGEQEQDGEEEEARDEYELLRDDDDDSGVWRRWSRVNWPCVALGLAMAALGYVAGLYTRARATRPPLLSRMPECRSPTGRRYEGVLPVILEGDEKAWSGLW